MRGYLSSANHVKERCRSGSPLLQSIGCNKNGCWMHVGDRQGPMARLRRGEEPKEATAVSLPPGTIFAWVHTPQYDKPVEASDEPPEDDEPHALAYSFIFPNGYAEPTLIRIVDEDDEDDGYTLEVEPLSGRVLLHEEEVELDDVLGWIPEEGPELDI